MYRKHTLCIWRQEIKGPVRIFSTKPSGWAASHLELRLARKYFVKNRGFLGALNITRNIKTQLANYIHSTQNILCTEQSEIVSFTLPFLFLFPWQHFILEFSGAEHFTHIYICHMLSSRGHLSCLVHGILRIPQEESGVWATTQVPYGSPCVTLCRNREMLCFVRLSFCEILFRRVKYNQSCLFSFEMVSFIVFFKIIVFLH